MNVLLASVDHSASVYNKEVAEYGEYFRKSQSAFRGEKKTFTLPKAFVTDLKNGTIKSVMFYTSDGSNYIKFSPVCTLRLRVNK